MAATTTTTPAFASATCLSERGDVEYFYDETAVLEERDASDGSLLARYAYADRLLSIYTGHETSFETGMQYCHHDPLGSTANITGFEGDVQVSYRLDPWGLIRHRQGETVNRMVFTGQEHDEQTGLVYFGARYYVPEIARFATRDPYLGDPGVPPSLHRYLYAYSNPTVYVDLLGYISIRQLVGVDDDSVFEALSEDSSLTNVAWLAAKKTGYDLYNGVTGGFVDRQDERQEAYDSGEISESEYLAGTGVDAGISIGSQAAGGAASGKIARKVAGGLVGRAGARTAGEMVGEGVSVSENPWSSRAARSSNTKSPTASSAGNR